MNDYSEYEVTIKTHASYHPDEPDRPAELEQALRAMFPGIRIRVCPLEAMVDADAPNGPDAGIVAQIYDAYGFMLETF